MAETLDDFFANANILITGSTGFVGKVLTEKLLRSQTNINKLFILIRSKSGKPVAERVEKKIFGQPLFEKLKHLRSDFMEKIVILEGDICKPKLGLTSRDQELVLNEVNIIYHCAASINMMFKLKDNVMSNICSVNELLQMCRRMKHLKSVVLVSTAYSNCNKSVVEEDIYETPITASFIIELCSELDNQILENIEGSLLNGHPNTYTFTKSLMENMVYKNYKDLPIVLFRPAIVVCAYKEPEIGWVDNIAGPMGLLLVGGLGILRVVNFDGSGTVHWVPVDLCANALICSAWHGVTKKKLNNNEMLPVYNYAGEKQKMPWNNFIRAMMNSGIVAGKTLWKPIYIGINNVYVYSFVCIFVHFLPALLLDAGLILAGSKLRLNKIYREKIYPASNVLKYFTTNNWIFKEHNIFEMLEDMSPHERNIYPFNMDDVDFEKYTISFCTGLKKYMLKEDMKDLEKHQRRHEMLKWIHYIFLVVFWSLITWVMYLILKR